MRCGGYIADATAWRDFADENGLFLIEDSPTPSASESTPARAGGST